MELVVNRLISTEISTLGTLTADGEFVCHTLEDVVREVVGEPVESWKIFGQTAIPAGTYRVTLENSPHFGPDTMTINDVPGYAGVRIHGGNRAEDTEGCLILGNAVDMEHGTIVGGTSQPAVAHVKSLVATAIGNGEDVSITFVTANA